MTSSMVLEIVFLVVILSTGSSVSGQSRPPNFSPDAIPDTNFSCEDKITGGYYADLEADCQLFHVCVQVSEFEFQDFRFLCPNDTVFDQQNLVCTNWFEVDCKQSVHFFAQEIGLREPSKVRNKPSNNFQSGQSNFNNNNNNNNNQYDQYDDFPEGDYDSQLEDEDDRFLADRPHTPNSGNRGVGGRQKGQGFQGVGIKEDNDVSTGSRQPLRPPRPTKTTTAIPIDVTTKATTRRPPRVKSNIRLAGKHPGNGGAGKSKVGNKVSTQFTKRPQDFSSQEVDVDDDDGDGDGDQATPAPPGFNQGTSITDDRSVDPFRNPPLLSADGKKPRVKSNIKANKAFVGQGQGIRGQGEQERGRHRVKAVTSNIEFVAPQGDSVASQDDPSGNSGFLGPEVKPDGRPPRVKANQLNIPLRSPVATQVPVDPVTNGPLVEVEPPFINILHEEEGEIPESNPTQRPVPTFGPNNPGSPRVKSNIVASQRNRFRGPTKQNNLQGRPLVQIQHPEDPRSGGDRHVPLNAVTEASPDPKLTKGVQNFLAKVPVEPQRPLQPQFIDEIDEFEVPVTPTEPPQEVTTFPFQPPIIRQPSPKVPRVKANILASGPNKSGPPLTGQRQQSQEVEFENTGSSLGDSEDDGTGCHTNPFKCPPSQVADGRKPRVKSNIKASSRNFFFPNGKTNRIKGKVKPDRGAFNQFLSNLRTRKGKSSRGRGKIGLSVTQNELDTKHTENSSEETHEPSTTTENLLQVLLDQIKNDEDDEFENPPSTPRPFVQPKRPENQRPVEASPKLNLPTKKPFRHSQRRPLPQEFSDAQRTFIADIEDLEVTTQISLEKEEEVTLSSSTTTSSTTTTTTTTTQESSVPDLLPFLETKDPQFPTPQSKRQFKQQQRLQQFLQMKQNQRKVQSQLEQEQQAQGLFPSFPTVATDLEEDFTQQSTRFPPLSRPTPAPATSSEPDNVTDTTTTATTSPSLITESEVTTEESTSTTEAPTTTLASTRRPKGSLFANPEDRFPRVKSNILAANREGNKFGGFPKPTTFVTPRPKLKPTRVTSATEPQPSTTPEVQVAFTHDPTKVSPTTSVPTEEAGEDHTDVPAENGVEPESTSSSRTPSTTPPQLRPDSRSPRVKSNIKAQLSFLGKKHSQKTKVPVLVEESDKERNDENSDVSKPRSREGSGRAINLDLSNFDNDVPIDNEDDEQPVVRPDGQKPRVKSNILATLKSDGDHSQGSSGTPKHKSFRHSTKVSTNLKDFDNNSNASTIDFRPTPKSPKTKEVQTTTEQPSILTTLLSIVTESSILGDFFSTQVLNTRAIDPTLELLHQSTLDQRGISARSTPQTFNTTKPITSSTSEKPATSTTPLPSPTTTPTINSDTTEYETTPEISDA